MSSRSTEEEKPTIITVTGTKGKTTVSRLIDEIYRALERPTLLVDTHGHYLNGVRKSTHQESSRLYGLYPTVCPGRFLYELRGVKNAIAVLETSVGSSASPGMGYRVHHVGVLTNIYEDHIGRRIKSRKRLAQEKAKLIFKRVKQHGAVVFNADDARVTSELRQIPRKREVVRIPVGLTFSAFDRETHRQNGGHLVTYENGDVVIYHGTRRKRRFSIDSIPWTFQGNYEPSVYNIMFATAAVYAQHDCKRFPVEAIEAIRNFRPKEQEGRLQQFTNPERTITAIIDYAHEKYSLREVAKLARNMSTNKTIGVIRFAPDRTDKQLQNYGKYLANRFDVTIIYDKIDGVTRRPTTKKSTSYRDVGEVSGIVSEAMKKHTTNSKQVYRIIEESDAVARAFGKADRGDVLVHIFGNDSLESVRLVKEHLFH